MPDIMPFSRAALTAALILVLAVVAAAPAAASQGDDIPHVDSSREVRSASFQAAAGALPTTWCGTESSTERPYDTYSSARPQVKVVYVRPADKPNRFDEAADALQASASAMTSFVAASSGYRKTLRFDLGTDCGVDQLDITSIVLNSGRAAYLDASGFPSFDKLSAELNARLPRAAGPRSYLVFADYLLNTDSPLTTRGQGSLGNGGPFDRIFAMVYAGNVLNSDGAWYSGLLLHELGHNLGAVHRSAPNATPYGHCTDESDVMCYDDDGAGPVSMRAVCAPPADAGPVAEHFDCNGDDYFNVNPAPGSFLARTPAANVYNSPLLGDCGELFNACGENRYTGSDRDGDGMEDAIDACPDAPGFASMNGCVDSDGDGVADQQDVCPTLPGGVAGCPDFDGDGLPDPQDRCPTQTGNGSDGCPTNNGGGGNGGNNGGGTDTDEPKPRRKSATVRAGKRKAGKVTVIAGRDGSDVYVNATASFKLPKGRYKATLCAGTATSSKARKLRRGAECVKRTVKLRRTKTTKLMVRTFSTGSYAAATLTVKKSGKRKTYARAAKLPVLPLAGLR